MRKSLILMMVLASGMFSAAMAEGIQLKRVNTPPKIDGDLSDACWKDAVEVPISHVAGSQETSDKNKALVTSDDQWLYVAYDIGHPARDRVPCKFVKGLDDFVQRDDCVKLSFDSGTDGKLWYHLKVSRANIRQDRRFSDGKIEVESFNIPWRSATRENENNWTAELAIPLCLLYPFDHPEKARFNLLTTTITQERDPQGIPSGEPKRKQFSAAQLDKDFNEPGKFIPLKGLDFSKVKAPFLPFIEKTTASEYTKNNGKYSYGVDIIMKSFAAPGGKTELILTDKTVDGKERVIKETVEVPSDAGEMKRRILVPVNSLVKRTASLRMIDPLSGELLQVVELREDDMRSLDLISVYASRNYYASDRDAVAVCEIRLPKAELAEMTLSAVDAKGTALASLKSLSGKSELRIPLDKLAMGGNTVEIRLMDNGGLSVSSLPLEFIRRAPKPGCEWQIDKVNRVLLNNGVPFFGMGFISHRTTAESEKELERISAAGFNIIMRWQVLKDQDEWVRFLALAEKHNLVVMPAIDDISGARSTELDSLARLFKGKELEQAQKHVKSQGYTALKCRLVMEDPLRGLPKSAKNEIFQEYCDKNAPLMKTAVETAMNSKALMGYFLFDEPAIPLIDQWKMGREIHGMLDNIDGYHPTIVNYSSEIPDIPEATDWFDILMNDPYWSPAEDRRNSPDYVSKITSYTYSRGALRHQPAWVLPVAPIWSGTRKRIQTAAEQACQTYLAAINGATGILYFAFENINDKSTWDAVSEMARQFKTLGPMFTSPMPEQEISYYANGTAFVSDPKAGRSPDIQFVLRRSPTGELALIAANCRYYPVDANVTISGLSGSVGQYFNDKVLPVAEGSFSDVFELFGVRAYKLPKEFTGSPAKIEIRLTPPAQIPPRETAIPFSGREGRKNFFPNPSFEETSTLGWPDYFLNGFSAPRIGPMIGEKGAVWGTDESEVKFGKKSLRIVKPCSKVPQQPGWFYWKCAPQFREPTPCVFSVWLKGSAKGLKCSMQCNAFKDKTVKTFTVTDQWDRYEFSGTFKPFAGSHSFFDIRLLDDGALWIDGVQLEKGDKATDFEE